MARGPAVAALLLGRRGLGKVVHVWLPVAVLAATAPAGDATPALLAAARVLVAAGCFAQVSILANDLFDRRQDEAAGKRRWIATVPLPGAVALLALVAAIGAGALAVAGGRPALLVYGSSLALGILYSAPPLRLKVRGLAGPVTYAAATAGAYALLPGVVLGGRSGVLAYLAAVVFLDKWVHLLHHQVTDHDADRLGGAATFAVAAGLARARALLRCAAWVATGCFLAAPALLLQTGPRRGAAIAVAATVIGLVAAGASARGVPGTRTTFARELPALYLGLGLSTVRLLPVLLLTAAALDAPGLWPLCLAAAATAAAELGSYASRPGPASRPLPAASSVLAAAGFALALVARVALLHDKPFWRDEAWVASLTAESVPAILATAQPAPVGFVLLAKVTALLAGAIPGVTPEIALRLLPLLCGLAAVAALPRLARALGASPAVSTTVLLAAAGAPPLVYYSRELKHYGVDLLLAALVPLLVLRFFGRDAGAPAGARPGSGTRPLAAALLAAPWVSFASVFPIAGAIGWGWAAPWRDAAAATRRRWAALTLLYALSFALALAAAVHRQAGNPLLLQAWESDLARGDAQPFAVRTASVATDCVRVTFSYFFPGLELIALPLAALGLVAWTRPGVSILRFLAVSTFSLTVAAVLAHRYIAAQGRFLLFAAPLVLLCVASGIAELGRRLQPVVGPRLAGAAPLAVAAAAAVAWTGAAVEHRLPPYRNDVARYFRYDILHDVEPLVAAAASAIGPGEPVLVSFGCARPFRWYAQGRLPDATALSPPLTPADAARALRAWTDRTRCWVLLLDEEERSWERMTVRAGFRRSVAATARGAQLWELLPLGEAPAASTAPRRPPPLSQAGPAALDLRQ
ncbi:MAG TPA: UbiA family prenyltransferase [bacterium]